MRLKLILIPGETVVRRRPAIQPAPDRHERSTVISRTWTRTPASRARMARVPSGRLLAAAPDLMTVHRSSLYPPGSPAPRLAVRRVAGPARPRRAFRNSCPRRGPLHPRQPGRGLPRGRSASATSPTLRVAASRATAIHLLFERPAARRVVGEHVEARAGRREQHDAARRASARTRGARPRTSIAAWCTGTMPPTAARCARSPRRSSRPRRRAREARHADPRSRRLCTGRR